MLNPLSEARDRTRVLMDITQLHCRQARTGTPTRTSLHFSKLTLDTRDHSGDYTQVDSCSVRSSVVCLLLGTAVGVGVEESRGQRSLLEAASSVLRALHLRRPGGPAHVKLAVEWDSGTQER